MNIKQTLFGFDFPMTGARDISGIKICGMESTDAVSSVAGAGEVSGISYFIKGLTKEMRDDLLNRRTFLEFWIEAIDHTKRTANRKLYPYNVFKDALESPAWNNMLQNGGIPGEGEHPFIKMYSDNANSEQNIHNNMSRVHRIEANNATHEVVGYRCTPEKTYFKIRTSLKNLAIVHDVLIGKRPCFSIRTMGEFAPEDAEGTIVATKIQIVTIDYVSNPANATSHAEPIMRYIDTANQEAIELQHLPKTGTESVTIDFEDFVGKRKLVFDKNMTSVESMFCMNLIEETPEDTSFAKRLSRLDVSIL